MSTSVTNTLQITPSATTTTTTTVVSTYIQNDFTDTRSNLTETGDMTSWISYSTGIITAIVLLEIIILLLMVICRKQQIKKEELAEGHVFIVRKYTRRDSNSSESNPWSLATQNPYFGHHKEEPEPQRPDIDIKVTTTGTSHTPLANDHSFLELCTVSAVPTENEVVSKPSSGNELRETQDGGQAQEKDINSKEGTSNISEHPNSRRPLKPDTVASVPSSNTQKMLIPSGPGGEDRGSMSQPKVQTTAANVNRMLLSDLKPGRSINDMESACKELDELEKQIHILSQSIPTLDLYGYEDIDKIKRVRKASRSIPTLLDSAGYENPDRITSNFKKNLMLPKGEHVSVKSENDDPTDKRVPSHVKGSALPLPIGATGEIKTPQKKEPVYSVVQKKKKSASSADLVSSDATETPPPVPPQTAEALYTVATVAQQRNVPSQTSTLGTKVADYQGRNPDTSQFTTESRGSSAPKTVYGDICKLSNEELYIDL